jgi:hypothetical protein
MEDPGIDGRIILRWIFRHGMGGMYWIDLAQEQVAGSCKHPVMNLLVPQNGGNFLTI